MRWLKRLIPEPLRFKGSLKKLHRYCDEVRFQDLQQRYCNWPG